MANSDYRNLFGVASTICYIKGSSESSLIAQQMCQGVAKGFGLSETDGDSNFVYFRTESHPEKTKVFDENPYLEYQTLFFNLIQTASPELSEHQVTILTYAAQAMLFAYSLDSSATLHDFSVLIGNVLNSVGSQVFGIAPYKTVDKITYHPFMSDDVLIAYSSFDYTVTLTRLNDGDRDVETQLVNYNWYDVNRILRGPDLQIMKDVENQYYYVSGKVIYDGMLGDVEECIEDTVEIQTYTGVATASYYRHVPCRKSDSYVGPVDYLKFCRIFNDGPGSSGFFDTGVTAFYIQNDKQQLQSGDYLTNGHAFYTYSGTLMANGLSDGNGRYCLSNQEYLAVPQTFGCAVPAQRMHIGDNLPRWSCVSAKDCTCSEQFGITGFKYVALELPTEVWTDSLQFRQTNPLSDIDRLRVRSWSIEDNPYIATWAGDYLWPYWVDGFSVEHWYVGLPVLRGVDTQPQLGFFQTFKSNTFNTRPSLAMYPVLATSVGNTAELAESSRSYAIGHLPLFSGVENDAPVKFNFKVSSNLSGADDVTRQFFGMGTAFSGKYAIELSPEENAGFFYTGFSVTLDGQRVNSQTLADSYSDSILCKYKTIKYISGYRNVADQSTVGLTNMYAKDATGNLYTYGYIETQPFGTVKQDGWSYFAEVPSLFENASYERLYGEQTVESYWPRYSDGPFSVENRVFLYPNAEKMDELVVGKINGIPTRVRFKLAIREEAVREIFSEYRIYPDGGISTTPIPVSVVRPDVMGRRTANPAMTHIFMPNDAAAATDYDFNNWSVNSGINATIALSSGMVDNNWAPKISGKYVPAGRNSNVYGADVTSCDYVFNYGVSKLYNGAQAHVVKTQNKQNVYYSKKLRSDGLYHAYNAFETTGQIIYTLPIFDLSLNSMNVGNGTLTAFPPEVMGYPLVKYDGLQTGGLLTGRDPLFYEYVGGRRGGLTASAEGGYHSKGICGDRWNGLFYRNFGWEDIGCYNGYRTQYTRFRMPAQDDKLVIFNTDTSGTDLWVNGASFTPFAIARNTGKLDYGHLKVPYQGDSLSGNLTIWESGDYINFDLEPWFKLRPRSVPVDSGEWFYNSGFFIGPFDRDVEIGITNGQRILAYTELFINDEQMSHYFVWDSDCDKNYVTILSRGRWIENNYPYNNPRANGYSILTVIPSGQRACLNIFSRLNTEGMDVDVNDPALTQMGISGQAILSLRTHIPLDADDYDYYYHLYSGEESWLSNARFIGNGLHKMFRLEHDGIENIAGTYSFVSYSRSGKLYPIPSEDYTGLATVDTYGNITYGASQTPESYWRRKSIHNGTKMSFSGYREGSRISFVISEVAIDYDVLPYQSYFLVTPSGDCTISGEMGYYGQADNCVFSEGVYLTNATANDETTEIYNPSYVSDVLKRIPTGMFVFPTTQSGHEIEPVLVAPSVMKQRRDQTKIEEGQVYEMLYREPPYNYNKLWWPALSDLETLNPGNTIENLPPGDANTFTTNNIMFCASQGQDLPNGTRNPNIVKTYYVQNIFQMYDSVATDAYTNSGFCITSGRGTSVALRQTEMSGAIVPLGTPLSFVSMNLI